jgi:hypothetical protein
MLRLRFPQPAHFAGIIFRIQKNFGGFFAANRARFKIIFHRALLASHVPKSERIKIRRNRDQKIFKIFFPTICLWLLHNALAPGN